MYVQGNRGKYTPAARPIQRINSSNIALPVKTILKVKLLEIENVCNMTQVGVYGEIWPEPSGNPLGSAHGISLVLRLYFTVHPSSCHNTDTVLIP